MFNPDVPHYLEHMGNAVAHLPRSDNPLLPRCRLSASRWFRAPVDARRQVCGACLRAADAPASAVSSASHRRKVHEPQVLEVGLFVWPEHLGWGLRPAAPVRFRCVGRPGVQGGAWRLDMAEALDPLPAGAARRQGLAVALQRALETRVGPVDKFYYTAICLEPRAGAGREAA